MRHFSLSILLLLSIVLVAPDIGFGFTETKSYILITDKDIAKLGAGRIQTVLNMVPGVHAGDSYISIRGIYKVRVVKDGKIINDPTSNHGGVKWETVSLEAVESIKIYKNSGGAAFGSDASGGVIIITTREKNDSSGFMQVHGGNFHTLHSYFSCQTSRDKLSLSGAMGIDKTNGFRKNSKKKKLMVQGDLAYFVDNKTRFSLFASKISENRGSPGLNAYPTLEASYSYDLFSSLFTAELSGFKNRLSYTDAIKKNLNPAKNLDKELKIKKLREELTKHLPLDFPFNIELGTGFEKAEAASTGFLTKKENSIWALSVLSGKLSDLSDNLIPIQLSLGLRLEDYSNFGRFLSPELTTGIKHDFWSLRLNLSKTHNMPSFYQRYYQSTSMKPNPDLNPEKAENLSLSLSLKLSPGINLDFSPFYSRITDRITFLREGSTGSYVNLGKVIYKGIDMSWDIKFTDYLNLKTSYTYLDAKDDNTGLFLTSKPRHKAMATLVYRPVQPLVMRLSIKYSSKVFMNKSNTKTIDSYVIEDLRMEYKKQIPFLRAPVTFFMEVKNLADKFYMYSDGYSAPPRTWITGFQVKF